MCSFVKCFNEKKLSYHLKPLGINDETTGLKDKCFYQMKKFHKEEGIKVFKLEFKCCIGIGITITTISSYSIPDYNRPNNEFIHKPGLKYPLKILFIQFGISKLIAACILINNPNKRKAVKYKFIFVYYQDT